MTRWRSLTFGLGALILICGLFYWIAGGSPVLLIFGALLLITAALEPIYGRASAKPPGSGWRPTGEKFVDPESGKLVTIWFDPKSGERRYIEDNTP